MSNSDADPAAVYEAIRAEAGRVLIGNEDVIEGITISLLTRGHVLLEGVPGVAKTTIANLIARTTGLEFSRIQMTPDLLPADITGSRIYRENVGSFELNKGPVFANLVVADEINRATPKTQSALLEAMQERTVTIEGETLPLPEPFMVIATQNPIEMEGVFELPEAQRDRFQFKLRVELPDREDERELLDRFDRDPELGPDQTTQVVTQEDIRVARERVREVYVAESIREYVLDIVSRTRASADIEHGGSPRATLAFLDGAKARAAIHGREYVIPDDVKALAEPILIHRLVLSTEAELGQETSSAIIERILESVDTPSTSIAPEPAETD
ncbi:AAA family ATPase [Halobaculum sp. EA56]|uniref:AAA family ATPase n=1 Tax=Halobaculum sp. EA56 TaxID=3421648 RepID=UPI003EBC250E